MSENLNPTNSDPTPAATSSPDSVVGTMPSSSPTGPSPDLFGRPHSPASRSREPGNGKPKPTTDTSGPTSFGSSASAALSWSLGNRLAERLASIGSTVYAQTWKRKVTSWGRLYWAHTASARRTSGNGCTGWPTVKANETSRMHHDVHGGKHHSLTSAARLAGWPIPKVTDTHGNRPHGEGGQGLHTVAGWNSPRGTDGTNGGPNQAGGALPADAAVAGWATPTVNDATGSQYAYPNGDHTKRVLKLPGQAQTSSPVLTGKRGSLSPLLSCWLMGFPLTWVSCAPRERSRKGRRCLPGSEMQSSPKSPPSS